MKPSYYRDIHGKDTIQRYADKYGDYLALYSCRFNIHKYNDRMGKKPGAPAEIDKQKANEYFLRETLIRRQQPKWRLWYWDKILKYLVRL